MEENIRQVTFSANYKNKRSNNGFAKSLTGSSRGSNSVINQAAQLSVNRIVLYKRGHFIESANSFFIIEISTTADGSLYVVAYDIQSNATLMVH